MKQLTLDQITQIKATCGSFGHTLFDPEDIVALCNLAIIGLAAQPKLMEDAPRDGTPIYVWHKIWKCWVAVSYVAKPMSNPWADAPWVEKTCATRWPEAAFTHWVPATTFPEPK